MEFVVNFIFQTKSENFLVEKHENFEEIFWKMKKIFLTECEGDKNRLG